MPDDHTEPTVLSLSERHLDLTRRWIVQAAADLLPALGVPGLTNAAIAARSGISERTLYRHFPSRDVLLDELAAEVTRRIDAPPPPETLAALPAYPKALFARYEATDALTRAALHPDVFDRIRDGAATRRWVGLMHLVDESAPHRPASERRLMATNIRFMLSASTWHYYRHQFRFSLPDTVASVELALQHLLAGMAMPAKPTRRRR